MTLNVSCLLVLGYDGEQFSKRGVLNGVVRTERRGIDQG
jgi:hypothetical protein